MGEGMQKVLIAVIRREDVTYSMVTVVMNTILYDCNWLRQQI